MSRRPRIVGAGTISLDTVESADLGSGRRWATDVFGGSAPYFAYAAAVFADVAVVGVVGDDFPPHYPAQLRDAGIDVSGIRFVPGETFRWCVRYEADGGRETLSTNRATALRARPSFPPALRNPEALFLGSTDPEVQGDLLAGAGAPGLTVLDTMTHWIRDRGEVLEALLPLVDVLLVNEEEALLLGGGGVLEAAASRIRSKGCGWVVVKMGPKGAAAFGPNTIVRVSAAQGGAVLDPTGAGDAFAGGFVGALAESSMGRGGWERAMRFGSATASYAIESFSVDALSAMDRASVEVRAQSVVVTSAQPESPGP